MHHRLLCPIRLEDIETFLLGKITLYNTFLIDIWHRIYRTDRGRKVFKWPIGSTCQPWHIFLLFQMPVDQLYNISFRPITVSFSLFAYWRNGLRMTSCMVISSPLHMQEMFYLLHFSFGNILVLRILTTIPSCPDRRRIHVHNIAAESTTTDSCLTACIHLMRNRIQFTHQTAYLALFKFREIVRPIIFITQSPDNDRRMIVVLGDHINQHILRLVAICFITDSTTAPRNLFPHKNSQFVTKIEDDFRLLIMTKAYKIDAHFLHHLHLMDHLLFSHGRSHTCMIFMAMSTSQQKTSAIQMERTLLYKFKRTEAETLTGGHLLSISRHRNLTGI